VSDALATRCAERAAVPECVADVHFPAVEHGAADCFGLAAAAEHAVAACSGPAAVVAERAVAAFPDRVAAAERVAAACSDPAAGVAARVWLARAYCPAAGDGLASPLAARAVHTRKKRSREATTELLS
jgi:hypothetical protein